MKLAAKFTLFNGLSRTLILVLFIGLLPPVLRRVAVFSTDAKLRKQQEQVVNMVRQNGISAFLEAGENAYGSYNLLKDEFISLEEIPPGPTIDIIEDSRREVEKEVIEYRVLSYSFSLEGKQYLLEIGHSTTSIGEVEGTFRQYAFYILLIGILLTMATDIVYFTYLLRPLERIRSVRLRDVRNPSAFDFTPIQTTTDDFRELDRSLQGMMRSIQSSFAHERRFIADASHELLTPLATLQHRFENMLVDESLSEENTLRVMDSLRTVHRLRVIIKSLMLISKIENDQFPRQDRVSLPELIDEIAEELQDRLALSDIGLYVEMPGTLTLADVNRGLISTLLMNLMHNAIKYNRPNGRIEVVGKALADGAVQLEVRDTGIGIAREELPHLFEPFHKVSNSDADSYGLGLSIVKTIADKHGIRLEVNSIVGIGTSIVLVFPAAG